MIITTIREGGKDVKMVDITPPTRTVRADKYLEKLEREVQLELFKYPYVEISLKRFHDTQTAQNRYDLECYMNRYKITSPILARYIQTELQLNDRVYKQLNTTEQ